MKKLIVAIAALAMFATSSYAAEWNFYGNVRLWTFYSSVEQDGQPDVDGTQWDLSPFSRIGANIKVSDELSARFEYGSADSVNLRLIYGEWNFGAGTLLIGQDWSPLIMSGSNQVWNGSTLGGWGELGGYRTPQLKLKIGGFRLALSEPSNKVLDGTGGAFDADGRIVDGTTYYTAFTENTLPTISAKYLYTADNWSARVVAGYNTFETGVSGGAKADVDAYLVGFGADIALGALTLNGTIHMGDNMGNLGNGIDANGFDDVAGYAVWDGSKVVDVEGFAYRLVANYVINDMLAFEIGYGFAKNEYDAPGAKEDEVQSYYVNMPITVAPGVIVTPEIGVLDYKEASQTEETYFGAHWRINF